jgi:cytoskeletal protein CcmA (bactofilin family)
MFKKWGAEGESAVAEGNGDKTVKDDKNASAENQQKAGHKETDVKSAALPVKRNKILKGSKVTGDICVTNDLELSGEVEGNIKALQNANIVLKGNCKGNIETKEGSVTIESVLEGGNIIAGKDVTISGKFNGGEVKAGGKIYVDGEFNGKLEANEIEIGFNAVGKGELYYKEFISIARGAKVEATVSRAQGELKIVKESPQKEAEVIKPDKKEAK